MPTKKKTSKKKAVTKKKKAPEMFGIALPSDSISQRPYLDQRQVHPHFKHADPALIVFNADSDAFYQYYNKEGISFDLDEEMSYGSDQLLVGEELNDNCNSVEQLLAASALMQALAELVTRTKAVKAK